MALPNWLTKPTHAKGHTMRMELSEEFVRVDIDKRKLVPPKMQEASCLRRAAEDVLPAGNADRLSINA